MSRTILWSRENFTTSNPYLQKELSLSALKESPKKDSQLLQYYDNEPTAAEVLGTPDEGLEATEDVELMVYGMATTAEDLASLGFVVMESAKERNINYYHTGRDKRQHSTATFVNAKVPEIRVQRRAPKRKRVTDSEDCGTEQGDLATTKKALLSTTSETQFSYKKVITKTWDQGSTSSSSPKDHVTEDTTTSVDTMLSYNAEDFFSNTEDFLSNTEDFFSNAEDLLSGIDDLTTSPEDLSPDMESCQLNLVKEQCKVFDKLMKENRLLSQELIKLSTLPCTRDTVEEISKGLKMITELSRRMRNCTASSLLNLTHVLLPDVS